MMIRRSVVNVNADGGSAQCRPSQRQSQLIKKKLNGRKTDRINYLKNCFSTQKHKIIVDLASLSTNTIEICCKSHANRVWRFFFFLILKRKIIQCPSSKVASSNAERLWSTMRIWRCRMAIRNKRRYSCTLSVESSRVE